MIRNRDISRLRIFQELLMMRNANIKIQNSDGTESTIDLTELAALDSIAAADLAKIDGITNGESAAGKAVVLDANQDFDNDTGQIRQTGATMATEAGTGVTAGVGTVFESSIQNIGGIFHTSILLDLTGLTSADSDLDVIGIEDTANPCHLGQIVAADMGTIFAGLITCLEAPSSLTDIDFYAAALATYVYEDLITDDASEVALITAGEAWTAGMAKAMTGLPAADEYLYVCNGANDTPDIFTAGKFLIEFWGN